MIKINIFNDCLKEKKNQLCSVKYLANGGSGYAADPGTPPVVIRSEGQSTFLIKDCNMVGKDTWEMTTLGIEPGALRCMSRLNSQLQAC